MSSTFTSSTGRNLKKKKTLALSPSVVSHLFNTEKFSFWPHFQQKIVCASQQFEALPRIHFDKTNNKISFSITGNQWKRRV
jgi:hypothetical protein